MLQSIKENIQLTTKGLGPFIMVIFVLAMAAYLAAPYLQNDCALIACLPSLESLISCGG